MVPIIDWAISLIVPPIICCGSLPVLAKGFPDSGSWKIMGFPIEGENAEKYLRFGALIVGVLFAIPFFVLRSEKAIKEFSN